MPSHMNAFAPYERKAPTHEDQLTRAFLIVLKASPLAHQAWLRLVDRAHLRNKGGGVPALHDLPAVDVDTQTGRVPDGIARLVSVLQTDERYFAEVDLKPSDRRQVLDGLVTYAPELAIAIENKPFAGNVWEGQLNVNTPADTKHDPRAACVRWADIVQAWNRLLDNGALNVAEAVLVSDFLDLVEEYFELLAPYSKVRSCGTSWPRLERRCRRLLEVVAGGEHVRRHRGWGWYIQLDDGQPATQIGLAPAQTEAGLVLRLEVDPGDTVNQARILFRDVDLAAIEGLTASGWTLHSNLHFAYRASNLMWTRPRPPLSEYWSYWTGSGAAWFRQVKREQFAELIDALADAGLVNDDDRAEFKETVTDTNRNTVNVCPGITLRQDVSLDEAARLEDSNALLESIKTWVQQAANALGLHQPSTP